MLPLALDHDVARDAAAEAGGGADFHLDLEAMTLTLPSGRVIGFAGPSFRRDALLRGADEIEVTLARAGAIDDWQRLARVARSWEWPAADTDNLTKETT